MVTSLVREQSIVGGLMKKNTRLTTHRKNKKDNEVIVKRRDLSQNITSGFGKVQIFSPTCNRKGIKQTHLYVKLCKNKKKQKTFYCNFLFT